MRRHRSGRDSAGRNTAEVVWSRQKMLALLAGGVAAVLLVVAGLVLAITQALHSHTTASNSRADRTDRALAQPASSTSPTGPFRLINASSPQAIADAAMPSVPASASHPSALTRRTPPAPLPLPISTRMGPAGVPTGYPRTAAGALAQLAAIDGTALSSGSMTGVRDIIAGWAVPGGPTTSSWSGVAAMATLLDAAQNAGDNTVGSPAGGGQLVVVASPLMGLVKGTLPAGSDALEFVVPCLDIEVDVTLVSTARGATADCQQMVWHDGRWMIGAGPEPAAAPSVWPGTDLSYEVGYRDLRYAGIPAGAPAPATAVAGG